MIPVVIWAGACGFACFRRNRIKKAADDRCTVPRHDVRRACGLWLNWKRPSGVRAKQLSDMTSIKDILETMTATGQNAIRDFQQVMADAELSSVPFEHWTIKDVLPVDGCDALVEWSPGDEHLMGDTGGRRETRNATRVFVDPEVRARDARLEVMAQALDSAEARAAITRLCGVSLDNTALRLELSLDTDGFWLEPHTDIGAKKLTLLVALSSSPDADQWGTDLMDSTGVSVKRSSGRFNTGTMFVPGTDTWHGFVRRPISGVRRGLIINFVDSSWRAVHELAFGPATGA